MESSAGRRVLVLGDDVRVILPIARSLGRRGIEVHLAWVSPCSPARASRYAARVHELPRPAAGDSAWVEPLRELLRQESFDLVLPATEAAVHAVHNHRGELESLAPCCLLDVEVFRIAFDKSRMQQLVQAAGLPLPAVGVARSATEAMEFCRAQAGPVVVKPGQSIACAGAGKQFVQVLESANQVRDAVTGLLDDGQESVVLQSYFDGCGVGVGFLAENGQVLTRFQHRRLHETSGHGSTCRVGEPVSPELADATAQILAALNYTGVGMCEFRRNCATGEWIFVELNPRFWGSLPLACKSGADFPWYLCQLLLDGTRTFPQQFRTGLRCRSLTVDLRWIRRAWRGKPSQHASDRDQASGWRLNEVTRWQIAGDTLRMLLLQDACDTFALDDTAPFWREVAQLLRRPGRQLGQQLAGRKRSSEAVTPVSPVAGRNLSTEV